jgi:fatty acyl-CoA reductase
MQCQALCLDHSKLMFFPLFSWMGDDMLRDVTPALLEKRPNTYTFTKSLAESLLFKHSYDLPIAVFRPSIVGASLREPMAVS